MPACSVVNHPCQMATRRWRVIVDEAVYDVEARGSEWSGAVRVLVNGAEVRRGPSWRDANWRIIFPIGRHLATLVWTTQGRGSKEYDLVLDGRSVATGGQPRPSADPNLSLGSSLLLFVLSLAILGGVVWFGALPEVRLAVEGREVPAQVTGGHVETGRSNSFYLRYVFRMENGEAKTEEGRVSYATYQSTHPNDVIRVVYLPSAPDMQRPTSYDDRIWVALLIAMFAPGLLFTVMMVWHAYRVRSMAEALTDRAVRTTATVDKVAKGWGAGGLRYIVYRYEDAEGRSRKGTSPELYVEEASAYTPGSTATIAYDPKDPGNSMWLGTADPKTTVWVT